jgi:hypothetical protein
VTVGTLPATPDVALRALDCGRMKRGNRCARSGNQQSALAFQHDREPLWLNLAHTAALPAAYLARSRFHDVSLGFGKRPAESMVVTIADGMRMF